MINRALLRIKVVQMLYAYYKSGNDDLRLAESELQHSINKGYDLYYTLLLLVTEVTRYAELRQDAATHRKQRNVSNLVQHNRFIGNRFAQQLSENEQFQEYLSENKLSWTDFQNVVKNLFERIEESSYYEAYIEEEESYQHDKDLWIKVFKKEILGNELLEEALEELSIYWLDDLEIVLSFVVKTIRSFDESKGSMQNLLPKYKDDSDYSFVIRLFQNAILNSEEYRTLISKYTNNWDIDRIAFMDILLMQLAISELLSFPSIPINVTLNEYIELAKFYSTSRSSYFVNGVLDKIVAELKKEGRLQKL